MKISKSIPGTWFFIIAISSLFIGLLFGALGGLQYVFPGFLKEALSFQKIRPLHVYLVINWIFCAAAGAVYYYIPYVSGRKLYSTLLAKLHILIQLIILIWVVTGFFMGRFGGREYLEFPPYIVVLIIVAWILFMINFFVTVRPSFKEVPVYIWSWSTGLLFFLITICEAQLWLLPHFNNNIIRDITVQWKAMGSMVGSWNMLVYGSAMFVMEKITGDKGINRSKKAFFFYFLGLTNLLFNWGHHTYIVPSSELVRTISYTISMTELLILANIIYSFRKTYFKTNPHQHFLSFRIVTYAEAWILLNLILSISISVPAINFYTHGTHITVAHAMGTTIGINTLLLLSSLVLIAEEMIGDGKLFTPYFNRSFIFLNISLLVFWLSLVGMGICKIIAVHEKNSFTEMMARLYPYFQVFSISGIFVFLGLLLVLMPVFTTFLKIGFAKKFTDPS